jgi:hypothetical protein
MKSNTGEDWTYDHGVVTCTFGPSRLAGTWSWSGSDLKNDNAMQPQGVFDGTFVHWIMPGDKKAIYSLKLVAETADALKWTNTQIKWKSVVHWTHDLKTFSLSVDAGSGADHPEGCPVNWTVLGSFPTPVALMIAMVTRANKLARVVYRVSFAPVQALRDSDHDADRRVPLRQVRRRRRRDDVRLLQVGCGWSQGRDLQAVRRQGPHALRQVQRADWRVARAGAAVRYARIGIESTRVLQNVIS